MFCDTQTDMRLFLFSRMWFHASASPLFSDDEVNGDSSFGFWLPYFMRHSEACRGIRQSVKEIINAPAAGFFGCASLCSEWHKVLLLSILKKREDTFFRKPYSRWSALRACFLARAVMTDTKSLPFSICARKGFAATLYRGEVIVARSIRPCTLIMRSFRKYMRS